MEKVLLHTCCAVCSSYPLEKLVNMGYEPIVFFYNPNIYPKSEYLRRLNELLRYCDKKNFDIIVQQPDFEQFYQFIKGFEQEPEKGKRCLKCFELRLKQTFFKAKDLQISKTTTTLTISPHKISKDIFMIADNLLKTNQFNELEFLNIDFKKENGFLISSNIAKSENFYRQQYCGCKFSIKKS